MFTKKLTKRITSLVLCTVFMLIMAVPGFAAENEGNVTTLESLRFVDLIEEIIKVDPEGTPLAENAEGFSPDHENYLAIFPYVKDTNSLYVPMIEAVATDDKADVKFTNTDITKGAISIVVTAANGEATQTYTIIGVPAGENLYVDGGFETLSDQEDGQALVDGSGKAIWKPDKNYGSKFVITDEAATGTKAMKVTGHVWNTAWSGMFKGDNSGLKANKKYYASVQAKIAKDDTTTPTRTEFETRHTIRKEYTGNKTIYNADGTVTTAPKVYKDKWTELGLVLEPTANCNPVYHVVSRTSGADPDYALDDYYIGELVVSKVEVTNENGANSQSVALADLTEDRTITLSAKALNQYGTVAGLEGLTTVKEWRMAGDAGSVSVDNGTVTIPANTAAGTYRVEAVVDTTSNTTAGQGDVKGVFTIIVSDGSLESISVSAPHVIDFQKGTLNYTLNVPAVHVNGQDTYTMPVISAVAADGNHEVNVEYPEAVADGETICVYVNDKDGRIVDTYTFVLNTVGENLYVDGGFENSLSVTNSGKKLSDSTGPVWEVQNTTTATFSLTQDEGGVGRYAMKINDVDGNESWSGKLKSGKTLSPDKKYYTSLQAKLPANWSQESYTSNHTFRGGVSVAGTAKQNYDADGNKKLSNGANSANTVIYKDKWTKAGIVFTPSAESNDVRPVLSKWSASDPDLVVDDYYIGELVVSEISVTNENGVSSESVGVADLTENKTVTLFAKALNQYGTVAGLETLTAIEWVSEDFEVTEDGIVTIPANTPAGTYYVEARVDTSTATSAGQGTVKGVYAINVADSGSLESLSVSEPHVIDFAASKYNYTLDVPAVHVNGQDTYAMPVVSAVAADAKHKVTVEYPKEVAAGSSISVYVKDDKGSNVGIYTLTLNPIGGNLYKDGDFESGSATWKAVSGTFALASTNNCITGKKALAVNYSGGTIDNPVWSVELKDGVTLSKEKIYYASMQAKIPNDGAKDKTVVSHTIRDGASHPMKNNYDADGNRKYNGSGNATSETTLSKDDWTGMGLVFQLGSDISSNFRHVLTKWGAIDTNFVVDDYYVGELVASDIAIIAEGVADAECVERPADGKINLSTKVINQYQTVAGLEDVETVLSIVGAPNGVTLTDGVLTVPEGFIGKITVRADATLPEVFTQKKIYGELTLNITETSFKFTAGNEKLEKIQKGDISCELVYVNNKAQEEKIFFIAALYQKNEDGSLSLKSASVQKGVCEAEDKIYSDAQTITVPDDRNTYVVKAFCWRNDDTYYPLMESVILE